MRFRELEIPGVFLIEPEPIEDQRGFFARTFCIDSFAERGLNTIWVQHSISHNARAGTLRGMHFQRAPFGETKLVSCSAGAIYDVVVDLREGSKTFGRWVGVELNAANHHALYIPADCPHGFQTLVDASEVTYLISERYVPSHAAGLRWNDPALAIEWPRSPERVISERDQVWPLLGQRAGG